MKTPNNPTPFAPAPNIVTGVAFPGPAGQLVVKPVVGWPVLLPPDSRPN